MQDLLEWIGDPAGEDRKLDVKIAEWLGLVEPGGRWSSGLYYVFDARGQNGCVPIPRYTASIDAVVTAIESTYPGESMDILREAIDVMQVEGWRPQDPPIPQICRRLLREFLTRREDLIDRGDERLRALAADHQQRMLDEVIPAIDADRRAEHQAAVARRFPKPGRE